MSAAGIGITPKEIVIGNALAGSEYERMIKVFNIGNQPLTLSLSTSGDIRDWISLHYPGNPTTSIETITIAGEGAKILLRLKIPRDAAKGKYKAGISLLSASAKEAPVETGYKISVGADIKVRIQINGTKKSSSQVMLGRIFSTFKWILMGIAILILSIAGILHRRDRVFFKKLLKIIGIIIPLAGVMMLTSSSGLIPAAAFSAKKGEALQGQVKLGWVLPDMEPGIPGTQLVPHPGGKRRFNFWIALPEGMKTKSVLVKIYYPNGSLKSWLSAEEVSDSAAINNAEKAAINAGLITPEKRDKLRTETAKVYRVSDELVYFEPSGDYRVEAWGINQAGKERRLLTHSFEYRGLVAFNIDFKKIDFRKIEPGKRKNLLGDKDMATPARPTVQNLGNEPFLLKLCATPLIGRVGGDKITDFRARFLGQWLSFRNGEAATFDTLLFPGNLAQANFSIYVPMITPADTYIGRMNIFSVSLPNPQVEVLEPNGGEVWYPGKTYPIRWNAKSPGGGDLSIDIWFSPDGGNTWSLQIADNVPNTGKYNWAVLPELDSERGWIKVVATDSLGLYSKDLSDSPFSLPAKIILRFSAEELNSQLPKFIKKVENLRIKLNGFPLPRFIGEQIEGIFAEAIDSMDIRFPFLKLEEIRIEDYKLVVEGFKGQCEKPLR